MKIKKTAINGIHSRQSGTRQQRVLAALKASQTGLDMHGVAAALGLPDQPNSHPRKLMRKLVESGTVLRNEEKVFSLPPDGTTHAKRNRISAASIRVKSYVRAERIYPVGAESVSIRLSKRNARELARNLLMIALSSEVQGDLVIIGHRGGTVSVLGRLEGPAEAEADSPILAATE